MRLTPDYLESIVISTDYDYNGTHTVATITTACGLKFTGTSDCLDPASYDKGIGEDIARKNALAQLWEPEGYFFAKLGLGAAQVKPESVIVQFFDRASAQAPVPDGYERQVIVDVRAELVPIL
jgi:hypothetical protein